MSLKGSNELSIVVASLAKKVKRQEITQEEMDFLVKDCTSRFYTILQEAQEGVITSDEAHARFQAIVKAYATTEIPEKRIYGPLAPPEKRTKRRSPLVLTVFLSILCVCFGAACIVSFSANQDLRNEVHTLTEQVDRFETNKSNYNSLKNKYDKLTDDYAELEEKYEDASFSQFVMSTYAGITFESDNEAYFHTCLCDGFLDSGTFYIWPITYLDELGILPCLKCHTERQLEIIYELLSNS